MTARPLAPEADLATVLQLARDALASGMMLDPEDLLCQLLGLDEAQLAEHLEDYSPTGRCGICHQGRPCPEGHADPELRAKIQDAIYAGAEAVDPDEMEEVTAAVRGVVRPAAPDHAHRLGSHCHCQACGPCPFHPDQSVPASRARAREERLREAQRGVDVLGPAGAPAWRQAEAGTVQHLVLWGRPLCAADDAGPWRMVAGVDKCAGCLELEEVLGRHG